MDGQPRNFKLLAEVEAMEKGGTDMHISYGLKKPDDLFMVDFNASIMGPGGTPFQDRFYSLSIKCGPNYPVEPPEVRFETKCNMGCIDQSSGKVTKAPLSWDRTKGIQDFLKALLAEMHSSANKRLKQPAEDSHF